MSKDREQTIKNINQWARQNPTLVFNDNFSAQRQHLTDETWQFLADYLKDIKPGSKEYKAFPDKFKTQLLSQNKEYDPIKERNSIYKYINRYQPEVTTFRQTHPILNGLGFTKLFRYNTPYSNSEYDRNVWDIENTIPLELTEMYNKGEFPSDEQNEAYMNRVSADMSQMKRQEKLKDKAKNTYQTKLDENFPYWFDTVTGHLFSPFIFKKDGKLNNDNIVNKAYRAYRKYINPIQADENSISGEGTNIVDLSTNALRSDKNSKQKSILFNEFVEEHNPSIYPASKYADGSVTTFGDRNIPRENVNIFAGVEDGKYKAGPIEIFNPNTLVYPARNVKKSLAPITNFSIGTNNDITLNINDRNYDKLRDNINVNNKFTPEEVKDNFGLDSNAWNLLLRKAKYYYETDFLDKNFDINQFQYNLEKEIPRTNVEEFIKSPWYISDALIDPDHDVQLEENIKNYIEYAKDPLAKDQWEMYINENRNKLKAVNLFSKDERELLRNIDETYRNKLRKSNYTRNRFNLNNLSNLVSSANNNKQATYGYTDINGHTGNIPDWNASILDGKFVLANPNGGLFINRVQNMSQKQLDWLNEYLKENPSYIIRPDLGGFGQVYMNNPTYKQYISQYSEGLDENDPNIFAVGTNNEPMKFKFGGNIKKRF